MKNLPEPDMKYALIAAIIVSVSLLAGLFISRMVVEPSVAALNIALSGAK